MAGLELPKYNEICVFTIDSPKSDGRIERYYNCLERKFVTRRINGILRAINEFKRE